MILTGMLTGLGEQRVEVSLCIPQIAYRMPWEEYGSVLRSWRKPARIMSLLVVINQLDAQNLVL